MLIDLHYSQSTFLRWVANKLLVSSLMHNPHPHLRATYRAILVFNKIWSKVQLHNCQTQNVTETLIAHEGVVTQFPHVDINYL